MWFAVAHFHHLIEKIRVEKQAAIPALIGTLVQLTYTSIFGVIASFFLVRTGNIVSPITSHIICNFVGLPDLGFLTPPDQENSSSLSYLYPYRYPLLALHGIGLILFYFCFWPLTESLAQASPLSLLSSNIK
jgi:prenyl protein peptidase